MSSLAIAAIAYLCVFGSGLFGLFLRANLPEHHLNKETMDVVKLVMGLVATLAALVLGLLTASAKAGFDTETTGVQQSAAKIIELDRTLALYGSEASGLRAELRQRLIQRLNLTWPEESVAGAKAPPKLDAREMRPAAEGLLGGIRALSPQKNPSQRDGRKPLTLAKHL